MRRIARIRRKLARDLGIPRSLVYTWIEQFGDEEQVVDLGLAEEMHQLKLENSRLREENEILKKAIGVISSQSI